MDAMTDLQSTAGSLPTSALQERSSSHVSDENGRDRRKIKNHSIVSRLIFFHREWK
jgi:hypothetical protein